MSEEIRRVTDYTFQAIQMTTENMAAVQSFISSCTVGTNVWSYDGNGDLIVVTGRDQSDSDVWTPIHPGDRVFKEFTQWWVVMNETDFDENYEVLAL